MFLDRFTLEHYIFAKITLEKKPAKYFEAFEALFEHILDVKTNPDFALFLDVNFEVVKQRIIKRNRSSEVDNFDENLDYFYRLWSMYKDEFISLANRYKIPFVIIDANENNEEKVLEKVINEIEKIKDKYL
ncbi:deoxyguanosine kinase [Mycoplasma crocodyli MP145]|uniref:Deoxyguanosine kinase n=2 Tax=Mycoplasma TaxID=2093 RepID=D5E5L0_MYCCM|nr:deoxyguanosine kinase [Mycoplasma crocodyli MP145]